MISLIVAMDEKRLIGYKNDLPWRLPADLQYFKRVTMGKPIVMGRKTFQSIGRILPGRENVVLTRDEKFSFEGVTVFHSIEAFLNWSQEKEDEIFVIGGSEIFKELFNEADRLYITQIHHTFEGDTYFPVYNGEQWQLISREEGIKDEENPYDFEYLVYERTTAKNL